jgi:MOSC domain-containing protein
MGPSATLNSIYRYPVKGLSGQPLTRIRLAPGQTIPCDRLYAVENGPSSFDPAVPKYFPKIRFLMLMRNERLAELRTEFDEPTHTLVIMHERREAARGDLQTPEGRAAIEHFFADFCDDELRGPPKVLHAPGHSFSDVARKVISIINLASVAAVENAVGAPVHQLRFRGNLYVSGWPAWHELELVGREIAIGSSARLKIVKPIERCAATNVDPDTGIRDLNIPQTLIRTFGHTDCGIYGEVVAGGEISVGDVVGEVLRESAGLPS